MPLSLATGAVPEGAAKQDSVAREKKELWLELQTELQFLQKESNKESGTLGACLSR